MFMVFLFSAYIRPFISELQPLTNYALKSQWKYQVPFEFTNKQVSNRLIIRTFCLHIMTFSSLHQVQGVNGTGHHFSLSESDLPHIITSIESKLSNSISDNPTIHLVVYVPPCSNSPLHIYKANGMRASSHGVDAFISPKWGGIVIANPTKAECSRYMENQELAEINVNSDHVMHTLLFLLRKIVDIHVDVSIN